jgi:hypothetical protein
MLENNIEFFSIQWCARITFFATPAPALIKITDELFFDHIVAD